MNIKLLEYFHNEAVTDLLSYAKKKYTSKRIFRIYLNIFQNIIMYS